MKPAKKWMKRLAADEDAASEQPVDEPAGQIDDEAVKAGESAAEASE